MGKGTEMAGYQITINGETHNKREWCKIYHVDEATVRHRQAAGMTFQEALVAKKGRPRRKPKIEMVDGRRYVKTVQKLPSDKRCRNCYYGERAEGRYVCMYIVIHPDHHRRGCEAGDKCTKWEPRRHRVTDAQRDFIRIGGK